MIFNLLLLILLNSTTPTTTTNSTTVKADTKLPININIEKENEPLMKEWDWLLAGLLSAAVSYYLFTRQLEETKKQEKENLQGQLDLQKREFDREKEIRQEEIGRIEQERQEEERKYIETTTDIVNDWLFYIRDSLLMQARYNIVYELRYRNNEKDITFYIEPVPVDRFIQMPDKDLMLVIGSNTHLYTKLTSNMYYIQGFVKQLIEQGNDNVKRSAEYLQERNQLYRQLHFHYDVIKNNYKEVPKVGEKIAYYNFPEKDVLMSEMLGLYEPLVLWLINHFENNFSGSPDISEFVRTFNSIKLKREEKEEYTKNWIWNLNHIKNKYIEMACEITIHLKDLEDYNKRLSVAGGVFAERSKNEEDLSYSGDAMDFIIHLFNEKYSEMQQVHKAHLELRRRLKEKVKG